MTAETAITRVPTASHWGAYRALVRNGAIIGVEPFASDREPSSLIAGLPGILGDKSRIREPHVRAGYLAHGPQSRGRRGAEPFVPVAWETALDLVAAELRRVKETHGNAAIFGGSYGWASAGRLHNARYLLQRFLNCYGGFTTQVTNYSFAAAMVIVPHIVGSMAPVAGFHTTWRAMRGNTKLFVAFGGVPLKNGQIDHGGVADHNLKDELRALKASGCEFVLISPLREDAADFLGAEWIAARPSTDAAIMLGLAHTLVAEGLADRGFLDRYCTGFDRFLPYLMGETDGVAKDADWAARIAGLSPETIRALARRMAQSRTMISASWSVQRTDHGEQPYWLAITLAAMLGQIGLPGAGFGFGYGAVNGYGNPRRKAPAPAVPIGHNAVKSFIPVARIADLLLHPGEKFDFNGESHTYPDIRLVYWCGGNPFHHHQDLNRLVAAWQRPETVIVHEPFWTPLARHADIVLPATTSLERNDISCSDFDRFILAMKQAVAPHDAARNDYDILAALAFRLGVREAFTEGRSEMDWLRHIYDVARQRASAEGTEMPSFDGFWEAGHFEAPVGEEEHTLFADFRADPVAHALKTPSGKIEIYSATIAGFGYDDCPGHPAWLEPAEWLGGATAARFPLHLISNQPMHRLHSQLDNAAQSRAAKISGREPVLINPTDAAARGIADGDIVRLYNDRGACLAGAVLSAALRPGVVRLATGAWFDPAEPGRPGALDKHGNPNMLTLDKGTSRLAQGPIAQSALIEVERYAEPAPAITAFAPPPIQRDRLPR